MKDVLEYEQILGRPTDLRFFVSYSLDLQISQLRAIQSVILILHVKLASHLNLDLLSTFLQSVCED